MTNTTLINLENVSEEEASGYQYRGASRAVVFDEDNKIALLHVTKKFHYKLPGGGIDGDETPEEALKRECLEEIGCNVEIVKELGSILEYRKQFQIRQESFFYKAKLIGEKGESKLEPDEIEDGFETIWVTLEDAIEKIRENRPDGYANKYMVVRDLKILEACRDNMQ